MASPARDLVFISYSHADATWLERLQKFLKPYVRRGQLQLWADTYVKVGERWERKIDQALDRTAVGVLLVSQDLLASDFVLDEELPALREAEGQGLLTLFCIPISASTYEAADLGTFQWARDPDEPLEELEEPMRNRALVEITKKLVAAAPRRASSPEFSAAVPAVVHRAPVAPLVPAPTARPGALHGVPEFPPHYLPRSDDLDRLRSALLGGTGSAMGITGISYKLGLQGQGGIGKSVLAAALARDEEVRRAFPDGVYWVTLGQQPDLLRVQSDLLQGLGGDESTVTSAENGRIVLAKVLNARFCLLVVDDAWDTSHARAFDAVGSNSRLVVTTRDATILTALGAREERVERLPEAVALELLASWSGQQSGSLPDQARQVAEECGYLPLALSVAGARVRDGLDWTDLLDALKQGRLEFLDHPYANVFRSMRLGIDALSPYDRERYLELAVFPEDVRVPEAVVLKLWRATAGLDGPGSKALLVNFARKALLERSGADAEREISFHDLQHDFLRILADDLPRLNDRLLYSFSESLPVSNAGVPAWHDLEESNTYAWLYLAGHLIAAGRGEEMRRLFFDYRWLESKLRITGVSGLLSDCDIFSGDEELSLLAATLHMSAHVVGVQKDQLPTQLLGRLLDQERPRLRDLLESVHPGSPTPWLRPLNSSLFEPSAGLVWTFEGHTGLVYSVAITPDGRHAVSGSWDTSLKVWDLEKRRVARTLEGHRDRVAAVAITPDGRYAVSGSGDNTLRAWDLESGLEVAILRGHMDRVVAVAVTPDGRYAVSGSADKTLKVWDLESGRVKRTLVGHTDQVTTLALTPGGRHVLSGSADKTLKLWEMESGRAVRTFKGHVDSVTAVSIAPDGCHAISGSDGKTLKVWDLESGRVMRTLEGHTHRVAAVAITPDGRHLVSGSGDRALKVWDLVNGQVVRTFEGHTDRVAALAVTPDGRHIVSGSWDGTLKLWNLESKGGERTQQGHTDWVAAMALTPDGRHAVSASWDKMLIVWDLDNGRVVRTLRGHTDRVAAVAVTPDGCHAVSGSWDKTLKVWDLESGREVRTLRGHGERVTAVVVTPGGRYAVSGSGDNTLRVWDLETGGVARVLAGHTAGVAAVAITPDGRYVVSGSRDSTLIVWDLERKWAEKAFERRVNSIAALGITLNGQHAVSGLRDSTLEMWDLRSGRVLQTLKGHTDRVTALAMMPDGRHAVSGSGDKSVRVWDLDSGRVIASFTADAPIKCCAVAGDGVTISAGDELGRVHFLRLEGMGVAKNSRPAI